jgi:hypothetical protein
MHTQPLPMQLATGAVQVLLTWIMWHRSPQSLPTPPSALLDLAILSVAAPALLTMLLTRAPHQGRPMQPQQQPHWATVQQATPQHQQPDRHAAPSPSALPPTPGPQSEQSPPRDPPDEAPHAAAHAGAGGRPSPGSYTIIEDSQPHATGNNTPPNHEGAVAGANAARTEELNANLESAAAGSLGAGGLAAVPSTTTTAAATGAATSSGSSALLVARVMVDSSLAGGMTVPQGPIVPALPAPAAATAASTSHQQAAPPALPPPGSHPQALPSTAAQHPQQLAPQQSLLHAEPSLAAGIAPPAAAPGPPAPHPQPPPHPGPPVSIDLAGVLSAMRRGGESRPAPGAYLYASPVKHLTVSVKVGGRVITHVSGPALCLFMPSSAPLTLIPPTLLPKPLQSLSTDPR